MVRILLIGTACVASSSAALATEPPSARDLLRKAIDYRKAMGSGHLVMDVKVDRDASSPAYERIQRRWALYFRGDRARSDCHWTHPDGTADDYHTVITPNLNIKDRGHSNPVQVRDTKTPEPMDYRTFHPRVIGMVAAPVMTLDQYGLQQVLLRDDYVVREPATAGEVGGRAAWVCEAFHKSSRQTVIRAWVIPDAGHAVAKIESDQGPDARPRGIHSVESEYDRFGSTWFPKRVTVTWTEDSRIVLREETVIREAEFGPVSDEVFTLEGLDLASGREVRVNGFDRKYWDGKSLGRVPPKSNPSATPESPSDWVVWALRLAAVGLAVIGVALLYGRFRARFRAK